MHVIKSNCPASYSSTIATKSQFTVYRTQLSIKIRSTLRICFITYVQNVIYLYCIGFQMKILKLYIKYIIQYMITILQIDCIPNIGKAKFKMLTMEVERTHISQMRDLYKIDCFLNHFYQYIVSIYSQVSIG